MLIKSAKAIPESEITDPHIFQHRRKIIKALASLALTGSGLPSAFAGIDGDLKTADGSIKSDTNLSSTPVELVKNYTNYYEFAFNKQDATQLAQNLQLDPWTLEISGEVENPFKINIDSLFKESTLQERIYRFRCVEGWSMVIPWLGISLANILKQVKPLSSAKFVKFTSAHNSEIMRGGMLDWPYVEGLRIDEATHPLTILAVGMYGEMLPKQNGAPLRLVVPWKYGFKSAKAIVKIELLKTPPLTSWTKFAPKDYGFYANVNPYVPHPRWSQISERPLGSSFFVPRRQTEIFNGYGEQVASLYRDMDLMHFY